MGRPPQVTQESKPVRTRRKRGGTVTVTIVQAAQMLTSLEQQYEDLLNAIETLNAGTAPYNAIKSVADEVEAKLETLRGIAVEVPA